MSERPEYYSDQVHKMDEFRALFATDITKPSESFGVETPEQEEARRRLYFNASPDEQAVMRAEYLEDVKKDTNRI